MLDTDQTKKISLFSHPILTLKILSHLTLDLLLHLLSLLKNKLLFIGIVTVLLIFLILPEVWKMTWFISFWILTGVASSIGLGTGLHTFVLYVLPHVASVMTASLNCGGVVPPMLPSRYNFQYFGECNQNQSSNKWLSVLWSIVFQSVLWGFGSAVGELPPYFIAREAAQSKIKPVNEVSDKYSHEEEEKQALNQLSKQQGVAETSQYVKNIIISSLKNHGFITILFLASIPNPFFDLAGLACGHFGIPLRTFFSATLIGKSFIKVHIQILMVLFLLSQEFLNIILRMSDEYYPKLHPHIVAFVQEQKAKMFEHSDAKSTWLETAWSFLIIAMVSYFVVSIIDAVVQRHYQRNIQKYQIV